MDYDNTIDILKDQIRQISLDKDCSERLLGTKIQEHLSLFIEIEKLARSMENSCQRDKILELCKKGLQ